MLIGKRIDTIKGEQKGNGGKSLQKANLNYLWLHHFRAEPNIARSFPNLLRRSILNGTWFTPQTLNLTTFR